MFGDSFRDELVQQVFLLGREVGSVVTGVGGVRLPSLRWAGHACDW